MRSIRSRRCCLVATCILLLAASAEANLITNGSFENENGFVPDAFSTMILNLGSTTMTGWTVSADQLAWIHVGTVWGLSAQDGNYFLDLTAYPAGPPFGAVTQSIATVPGQQYLLSFELGSYTQRWGGPPVSITASAGATSQTFTVSTTSTASTWTPFAMLFTASSANTTVSLVGAAGFEYIGLDNVNVDLASEEPVPEPGTSVLCLAGFGLLVLKNRMRRARRG